MVTTRWRYCAWPLWRLEADFSADDLAAAWRWLTEQWSEDAVDYASQAFALANAIRHGLEQHPTLSMSLSPYLDAWPQQGAAHRRNLLREFEAVFHSAKTSEITAMIGTDRGSAEREWRGELSRHWSTMRALDALPALDVVPGADLDNNRADPFPPWIMGSSVTCLFGSPGVGKSTVVGWLLARLSAGDLPADGDDRASPPPLSCLLVATAGEDRVCDLADRYGDTAVNVAFRSIRPLEFAGLEDIRRSTDQLGRYDVLAIDSREGLFNSREDISSGTAVKALLASLGELAEQSKLAVLLVAHARKSTSGTAAVEDLAGSVQGIAGVRSVLGVERIEGIDGGRPEIRLTSLKSNLEPTGKSLVWTQQENGRLTFEGFVDAETKRQASNRRLEAAIEQARELIVQNGGAVLARQLDEVCRQHRCSGRRLDLIDALGLEAVQQGRRIRGYRLPAAEADEGASNPPPAD